MVNLDSVPIRHPFVAWFAGLSIPLPGEGELRSSAIVMLLSLAVAMVVAHFSRFGANVYAIGGDRTSAALMGVPMRRTTAAVYALGGFYSALGGVIYALYTSSGYPLAGTGNELTAIASVVLGGTVLTGGVRHGAVSDQTLAGPLRVVGMDHEQPVPIFQQLAGGHPPGCDDVREIPAVATQRRGSPGRARDRHQP
jgi:ABC-type branched-subunit amino acid transport system permease subunit